jgi:hypothetical protein
MSMLKKRSLERYLRDRFGSHTTLLSCGPIGKESSHGAHKRHGYGSPVKVTFRAGRHTRSAVIETLMVEVLESEHAKRVYRNFAR